MAFLYDKVFFGDKLVEQSKAKLSIATSAILYGLSVYTVFPVHVGKDGKLVIFRLVDHYRRLLNSAKIIGIDTFEPNWNLENFTLAMINLIKTNKVKEDVFVRASIHVSEVLPGTRSRGMGTTFSAFIYKAEPILPLSGARLKTSVWHRIPDFAIPSRAKVNGAYVNSVLAKQDAIDSGYDDCIFLDTSGHVCELSAGNIFLVRDGKLITPAMSNDILEGINRDTIIQIAKDLGLEVIEREVDLTELYIADEVFACGTSTYLVPILEVDARKINGSKIGPITSKISNVYIHVLKGEDKKYLRYNQIINN
jgi:branched-chain amino acid aminotransferase